MKIKSLILASHGTLGARAAEEVALDLCAKNGASLYHLFVVPDFWKGMMGDDWLNNAVTRIRFGNYVENQLAQEAAAEIDRLAISAKARNIVHTHAIKLGKPADCLAEVSDGGHFDLVVIGSPRPKGAPGYRSRMALDPLARSLTAPLMIVPHPDR